MFVVGRRYWEQSWSAARHVQRRQADGRAASSSETEADCWTKYCQRQHKQQSQQQEQQPVAAVVPPSESETPTRLRSIMLNNHQQQSEPNSPNVLTGCHPTRLMRRQLSDLEPRAKKRVTIGGITRSSEVLFERPSSTSVLDGMLGVHYEDDMTVDSTRKKIGGHHPPIVSEEDEDWGEIIV